MDKIIIKDLEVYAHVGVFQEEKKLGQKFLISLEIETDFKNCLREDDLTKTINYGELCNLVYEEFKSYRFNLLEKASDEICKVILLKYEGVKSVEVKIKKPWAPIGLSLDFAGVITKRKKNIAYIALGSNMGDKEGNLNLALLKLNGDDTKVLSVSSFIVTEPVGYLDQDDFLNGACKVETILNPYELLNKLLDIEKELKRERIIRFGPRTIDLDILLFNDYIISEDELIIPHPRMGERLFVLLPLCEIAPYEVHPIFKKRILDLKFELT